MATTPAVSLTRQTLAGILAGATVATGAFATVLAVTAPQAKTTTTAADTTTTTTTVTADSDDDETTTKKTQPTTSTVTNPGTSKQTSQTSTRGS